MELPADRDPEEARETSRPVKLLPIESGSVVLAPRSGPVPDRGGAMRILSLLLSGCLLTTLFAAAAEPTPLNFEIVTLSNRADLISGGDALVEVRVPKNVPLKKGTLLPIRHLVTAALRTDEADRHERRLST